LIVIPGSATEALVEAVEASFPERAVFLEPLDGVVKGLRVQPRGSKLRRAAARDQACTLEDLEMLGNCLNADRKWLRQFVDRRLALGQARQDRPPRRIGESCKRVGQLVGRQF
jgi:hypothetical protein